MIKYIDLTIRPKANYRGIFWKMPFWSNSNFALNKKQTELFLKNGPEPMID